MARIYIGVGSNIEREHYIRAGWQALQQVFSACHCSTVYESDAVGFAGAPFFNLVITAQTQLSVADVAAQLRVIEFAHGRPADARKFSGRTLDLDLLAYDDLVISTPVELPRSEILHNAFVLRPFAELAPEWRHPLADMTLMALWHEYDANRQPLRAVAFDWC
jgi:2-amino-4-hydroxy-6-hydroxymethyldihydropteridine diphosphokinase